MMDSEGVFENFLHRNVEVLNVSDQCFGDGERRFRRAGTGGEWHARCRLTMKTRRLSSKFRATKDRCAASNTWMKQLRGQTVFNEEMIQRHADSNENFHVFHQETIDDRHQIRKGQMFEDQPEPIVKNGVLLGLFG